MDGECGGVGRNEDAIVWIGQLQKHGFIQLDDGIINHNHGEGLAVSPLVKTNVPLVAM